MCLRNNLGPKIPSIGHTCESLEQDAKIADSHAVCRRNANVSLKSCRDEVFSIQSLDEPYHCYF